jgi:FKBP-type peptidyl-prolyl cis-trans isomerase
MEEKKQFLEEWKFEDNFEKPLNIKSEKKMLNKKTIRENTKDDSEHKEKDKANEENENNFEKEIEPLGVIIEDAADLTDEQKMKRKNIMIKVHFKNLFNLDLKK